MISTSYYSRNKISHEKDIQNGELIQRVFGKNLAEKDEDSFHSPNFLVSAGLWWVTTASFQSPRARRVLWVFVGREEAKEEAGSEEDS